MALDGDQSTSLLWHCRLFILSSDSFSIDKLLHSSECNGHYIPWWFLLCCLQEQHWTMQSCLHKARSTSDRLQTMFLRVKHVKVEHVMDFFFNCKGEFLWENLQNNLRAGKIRINKTDGVYSESKSKQRFLVSYHLWCDKLAMNLLRCWF